MSVKSISVYSEETINASEPNLRDLKPESSLNIVHVFKSFQPVFIAVGLQKISLEGNNIKSLTNRAKIFQFLFLCFLVSIYCYSAIHHFEKGEEMDPAMSRSTHILTVNALLIVAASIYSSAIQNYCIYFKLVQNINYSDEKLKIPPAWYINIKFKLNIAFFLFIFYYGCLILWDTFVWKRKRNFRLYLIYVLLFSSDMIIFQYLFDIWIVISRLKMLTSQLIDLVQPILLPGKGNIIIDMDYSQNQQILNNKMNEISNVKCFVEESSEDGIIRLMSVYDKMADNVAIINSTYGVQLVLITACCLAVLLSVWNSFILFVLGSMQNNVIVAVGFFNWSFHSMVLICSYVVMGERLKRAHSHVVVAINKFQMYNFIDEPGRKRLFSLEQLINSRSMVLTAWRLFPIDATLISSFIGIISTYTVIIYQMNSM